jgi:hypothetical protein
MTIGNAACGYCPGRRQCLCRSSGISDPRGHGDITLVAKAEARIVEARIEQLARFEVAQSRKID